MKLARLLAKVRLQDADWVKSVFGEEIEQVMGLTSISSHSSGDDATARPTFEKKDSIIESEGSDTLRELFKLGYTPSDVELIKPSVWRIIVEKKVTRPRRDLPEQWLNFPSTTVKNLGTRWPNTDERRSMGSSRIGKMNGPVGGGKMARKFEEKNNDEEGDGKGEAFSWSSSTPPSRNEIESSRSMRLSSSRSSQIMGNSDASDEDDVGPVTFWPDSQEFKDMLLDESEWRVGLIGPWSAPLIRQEAKWRYDLYKKWLTFLDEGLGDGFDVVPESFEEEDVDEEKDGRNVNENETSWPPQMKTKQEFNSATNSASGGIRRSSTPSDRKKIARNLPRPPRTRSDAERYDEWIKGRVGKDGHWTELRTEEAKIREMRRSTNENRMRQNVFQGDEDDDIYDDENDYAFGGINGEDLLDELDRLGSNDEFSKSFNSRIRKDNLINDQRKIRGRTDGSDKKYSSKAPGTSMLQQDTTSLVGKVDNDDDYDNSGESDDDDDDDDDVVSLSDIPAQSRGGGIEQFRKEMRKERDRIEFLKAWEISKARKEIL